MRSKKTVLFGNHFKELLPPPVNKRGGGGKRQCSKKNCFRISFFFLKEEGTTTKIKCNKWTIKDSKWFFFSSSACWHLISSKWSGMISFLFSYQWHTPVAWRSHFRKGKICMAYLQQAASKPIRSQTCNWIPKVEMTGEHEEAAWPRLLV